MVFVFKPTIDTHNLKGKTVVVTGGSAGVGKQSCKVFASLGAHLIIAARNKEKTVAIINEIKAASGNNDIEFLQMDLGDLQSVKDAAQKLINDKVVISILMNNAGIAAIPGLTKDGFEIQFGTNHLGPFLFTELLIPLMDRNCSSRIIFLSSKAAENGKKYDFEKDIKSECTHVLKLQPYSNSKLANALYAKKLGQILIGTGITTYSLHPGVIATDIWKIVPWPVQNLIKLFMLSEEEGAYTQLFCALDSSVANETGLFYDDCKRRTVHPLMEDQPYIDELYQKSKELVAKYL